MNPLLLSHRHILTIFHLFGIHPLFEDKKTNPMPLISNYIPSVIFLCLNLAFILFNVIEIIHHADTFTLIEILKLVHSLVYNSISVILFVKVILNPLKLVKLLEGFNRVDESIRTRLNYTIEYKKIGKNYLKKFFMFSFVYALLISPYYIMNHKLYTLEMFCFEIYSDVNHAVRSPLLFFYVQLLNHRLEILYGIMVNASHKRHTSRETLQVLIDIYNGLHRITTEINDYFELYLNMLLVFMFIDFLGLTFYFCKGLQMGEEIEVSLTMFLCILVIVFAFGVTVKLTDNITKNYAAIASHISLINVGDTEAGFLLKEFASDALFKPIRIETPFFQFNMRLIIPVNER